MAQPIFRFAPSPTGYLHLGHAYAALYNQKICRMHNGKMLLRLENTDLSRCKPEFEDAIIEDLQWIGFEWEGEIRRQSDQFADYREVLTKLINEGFIYPSFMSRGEIRKFIKQLEASGKQWPRDPDGAPLYPGNERSDDKQSRYKRSQSTEDFAWRLDNSAARNWLDDNEVRQPDWQEMNLADDQFNYRSEPCDLSQWGDVVLARKNIPARYHLACVIDDGLQQITHVVRGKDIYHATAIHRALQEILNIAAPIYCHHILILDEEGRKLSKRDKDTSIRALRESGMSVDEVHEKIGLKA